MVTDLFIGFWFFASPLPIPLAQETMITNRHGNKNPHKRVFIHSLTFDLSVNTNQQGRSIKLETHWAHVRYASMHVMSFENWRSRQWYYELVVFRFCRHYKQIKSITINFIRDIQMFIWLYGTSIATFSLRLSVIGRFSQPTATSASCWFVNGMYFCSKNSMLAFNW